MNMWHSATNHTHKTSDPLTSRHKSGIIYKFTIPPGGGGIESVNFVDGTSMATSPLTEVADISFRLETNNTTCDWIMTKQKFWY